MKKTSVFQNSLIWFGAGVSIAEILTGTYFAPLGMAKGFAAVLLGHLIGCTMMFFAGLIGGRTGLSAMETSKLSFGKKGSLWFAALNVLQLVGWTAIMIYDGALAANGIAAHLGADLTGQGFVWFQNQCGAVALCNDIGHRKGFAGAGNAQQSLTFIPCFQALHQRFNSLGLVASRFERCFEVEHLGLIFLLLRHSGPPLLLVVYLQLKFVLYNLLLSHYSIDLFNCKGNTA